MTKRDFITAMKKTANESVTDDGSIGDKTIAILSSWEPEKLFKASAFVNLEGLELSDVQCDVCDHSVLLIFSSSFMSRCHSIMATEWSLPRFVRHYTEILVYHSPFHSPAQTQRASAQKLNSLYVRTCQKMHPATPHRFHSVFQEAQQCTTYSPKTWPPGCPLLNRPL